MIKRSIHQEVITTINIDAPKNRVLKIHEVEAGKLKRERKYNNSWRLQYSIFNKV